jgi:hypothetical protein
VNKKKAYARFEKHDKNAAFLGYTKVESDKWVEEVKSKEKDEGNSKLTEWF